MLALYADRKPSLAVLRRFPPHKYLVIPDVELHVKKDPCDQSYLIKIYPGSAVRLDIKLNDRALIALRRWYRSGDITWRVTKGKEETVFFHPGQVVWKIDAVDYSAISAEG
jgi:hypothetical protein